MKCKVCGQDKAITSYEQDDPLLECGHLQAGDPARLLVEEAAFQMEQEVAVLVAQGLTRDQALDQLIRQDLPRMSKRSMVSMCRVLDEAGISCDALEEAKKKLSSSSQRYIRTH